MSILSPGYGLRHQRRLLQHWLTCEWRDADVEWPDADESSLVVDVVPCPSDDVHVVSFSLGVVPEETADVSVLCTVDVHTQDGLGVGTPDVLPSSGDVRTVGDSGNWSSGRCSRRRRRRRYRCHRKHNHVIDWLTGNIISRYIVMYN